MRFAFPGSFERRARIVAGIAKSAFEAGGLNWCIQGDHASLRAYRRKRVMYGGKIDDGLLGLMIEACNARVQSSYLAKDGFEAVSSPARCSPIVIALPGLLRRNLHLVPIHGPEREGKSHS